MARVQGHPELCSEFRSARATTWKCLKKNMVKYNYIKNRAIKWGEEYKENKSRFEILFLDPSTTSKNASVCSKHTHGL